MAKDSLNAVIMIAQIFGILMWKELLTLEMRLRILQAVDLERKRLFSEVKEMGYSAIGTRTESLNRKVSGLMAKKTGFFDNGMKMDGCSRP